MSVGPPAGEVLLAYLVEQLETVRAREREVGAMDSDAIHKTRVATRRLRSVLSSYRRLFRRDETEPLRDELRWFAAALGAVRDMHVLREQLRDEASSLRGLEGLPASAERDLAEREAVAVRELHAALDSVRYTALRSSLERLVSEPPLRRRAGRPAVGVLPPLVGRTARLVDAAALHADEEGISATERDERLHEVRKAAKRARYAAELALPIGGKGAQLLVDRMTELQEVLGAHQDSVMSRRVLLELSLPKAGGDSTLDAGDAFAVGVLAGHEEGADEVTLAAYRVALHAASRSRVRRWTLDEDV